MKPTINSRVADPADPKLLISDLDPDPTWRVISDPDPDPALGSFWIGIRILVCEIFAFKVGMYIYRSFLC